jgi:hypothetical protein
MKRKYRPRFKNNVLSEIINFGLRANGGAGEAKIT